MMDTMRRSTVDEYDTGSYLEPSYMPHAVLRLSGETLVCDGAPSYDWDELNTGPVLCWAHAQDLLRTLAFTGPVRMPVQYDSGGWVDESDVMVRAEGDAPTHTADYSYGRAYFEPGEPRTAPCERCGDETLVDAQGYDDTD